ncbi:hypothetical protein CsSME_00031882 [Camellia sinensis var. sinensis]
MILTCAFAADPDDPLKTTDQTRHLGLIATSFAASLGEHQIMHESLGFDTANSLFSALKWETRFSVLGVT